MVRKLIKSLSRYTASEGGMCTCITRMNHKIPTGMWKIHVGMAERRPLCNLSETTRWPSQRERALIPSNHRSLPIHKNEHKQHVSKKNTPFPLVTGSQTTNKLRHQKINPCYLCVQRNLCHMQTVNPLFFLMELIKRIVLKWTEIIDNSIRFSCGSIIRISRRETTESGPFLLR